MPATRPLVAKPTTITLNTTFHLPRWRGEFRFMFGRPNAWGERLFESAESEG